MTWDGRDFIIVGFELDEKSITEWQQKVMDGLDKIDDPAVYDSHKKINYGWNIYTINKNNIVYFMIHLDWIDTQPIPLLSKQLMIQHTPNELSVYSTDNRSMYEIIKNNIIKYVSTKWIKYISGEWMNVVCSTNIIRVF